MYLIMPALLVLAIVMARFVGPIAWIAFGVAVVVRLIIWLHYNEKRIGELEDRLERRPRRRTRV